MKITLLDTEPNGFDLWKVRVEIDDGSYIQYLTGGQIEDLHRTQMLQSSHSEGAMRKALPTLFEDGEDGGAIVPGD